jgi:hypothetical protein
MARKHLRSSKNKLWRLPAKVWHRPRYRSIIVASLVAIVGIWLLHSIFAATPSVMFEAENSTLTGGATVISDTTASNNAAVLFKSSQSLLYSDRFGIANNATFLNKRFNIKLFRMDFIWGAEQPTQAANVNGTVNGKHQSTALSIQATGGHILATLDYTPTWAADPACLNNSAITDKQKCQPRSAAEYGNWAGAMATYYSQDKNGGIHDWEIWNEPNNNGFWKDGNDTPNPDLYADMVIKASQAIKAADPSANVIIGVTSASKNFTPSGTSANIDPRAFLMALYKRAASTANGGKNLTDYYQAVSHHPYTFAYANTDVTNTPNLDSVDSWSMMYRTEDVNTNAVVSCPVGTGSLANRAAQLDALGSNIRPSLRCIMDVYGAATGTANGKKIWATESGAPSQPLFGKDFIRYFNQDKQDNWIDLVRQGWVKAIHEGWAGNFYWFSGMDLNSYADNTVIQPDQQFAAFGLIKHNATEPDVQCNGANFVAPFVGTIKGPSASNLSSQIFAKKSVCMYSALMTKPIN